MAVCDSADSPIYGCIHPHTLSADVYQIHTHTPISIFDAYDSFAHAYLITDAYVGTVTKSKVSKNEKKPLKVPQIEISYS